MKKFPPKNFFPWDRSGDRRWTWRSGGYFGGPPHGPYQRAVLWPGRGFGRSLRQPAPHGPL